MCFTAGRVAMLIVLSICTHLITSHFVGQSRARARAGAADDSRQDATPQGRTQVSDAGRPANEGQDASGSAFLSAEMRIRPLEVGIDGVDVVVSTVADLAELRPNRAYVWSFQILAADGKTEVLKEQYYAHQLFRIPEDSQELHVPFTENVKLQPGVYHMCVRLYGLRPPVKMPAFAKGGKLPSSAAIGTTKRIVVGL